MKKQMLPMRVAEPLGKRVARVAARHPEPVIRPIHKAFAYGAVLMAGGVVLAEMVRHFVAHVLNVQPLVEMAAHYFG